MGLYGFLNLKGGLSLRKEFRVMVRRYLIWANFVQKPNQHETPLNSYSYKSSLRISSFTVDSACLLCGCVRCEVWECVTHDTWHMMDAFSSAHLSMWKITLHVYSIRRWNAIQSFARNKEMVWCDWAHRLFDVVWGVVGYILTIFGDIKSDLVQLRVQCNIKELNTDNNNVYGNARQSYWNWISLEYEFDESFVFMKSIASLKCQRTDTCKYLCSKDCRILIGCSCLQITDCMFK